MKAVVSSAAAEEKANKRTFQEVEAYSKLFFQSKIKPAVGEKMGVPEDGVGKLDLVVIKKFTRELYQTDFSRAYPAFDTGIMIPFRDFLYRVYRTFLASTIKATWNNVSVLFSVQLHAPLNTRSRASSKPITPK